MRLLKSPLYAQIELTSSCNLNCLHCYNEDAPSDKLVTSDNFIQIAQKLIDAEVFSVTLSGGEAFVVKDKVYRIIPLFKEAKMDVTINSNLTLITKDDAKMMKELNVDGIMTSLHSFDSKTHNRITGREMSFDLTLKGIELLLNEGHYVSSNMVVSKHNLNDVYKTGKFVHSLGVNSFSTAQAIPSVCGGEAHLSHALDSEEVLEYLEQLHQVKRETGMRIKLTNPLPYCLVWDKKPHLRDLVSSSTCTGGRTIIQVDPFGNVRACPMTGKSYGNILEEDLVDIWNKVQEWEDNKYVPLNCQPCDLVAKCRGGCRAEAQREVGDLNSRSIYARDPILDYQPHINYLKEGDKLVIFPGLKAREEGKGIYTLFGRDKYMVVGESMAKLVSAISSKKGLIVDRELSLDSEVREFFSIALESGLLRNVA